MALKKVPMYIQNVAKSIKYSGKDYLNNVMPETMNFVETNSDILKAVTTDLRNYKTIYKQAKTWWDASSVRDNMTKAMNNVMSDLKTGNFYNKDREDAAVFKESGWEEVLGGFEEEITSAINDYNSVEAQNNTTKSINKNTEATVGVMSAVGKAVTEITGSSAEFIVRNQNNIASKTMVNNYKMIGSINNILSDISANVRSIREYTNTLGEYLNTTSKINENVNSKIDQLVALQKELAEMERNKYAEYNKHKENNYVNDLDNSNFTRGTFDIKKYFETVFKRGKSAYENSMMGSMMGGGMMGVNPIALLASNPLKFISDAGFNKLVSKELRKSMEELDKTVNGFFKSAILKGTTALRNKADETGVDIFNQIADIVGIKQSNPGKMRTDLYVKDNIPYNGYADRAITEVMPTYLRKILSVLSGQEEMIYDYKAGKFNKITDVKKAYDRAEDDSYGGIDSMKREIEDAINRSFTMSNELQKSFDKDLKEFFKTIVDNQIFYNPNTMTNEYFRNKGVYFDNGEDTFRLINSAFKSLGKERWNKFNTEVINAGNIRREDNNTLNREGQRLGYTGVNNGFKMSYDKENNSNKLSRNFGLNQTDVYKKSVFDYMRDIRRILLEGIRVFPINASSANGDRTSIEGGSIEERIRRYREGESIHIATPIRDSEYNIPRNQLEDRAKKTTGTILDNLYNLGLSNQGLSDYMKRKSDEEKNRNNTGGETQNNNEPQIIQRSRSVIGNIYDAGKDIASVPGKFVKNILDSINDNLLFFLYGGKNRENGELSIFDRISNKINDFSDKTFNLVNDKIIEPLNKVLFNEENGIVTKINNKISSFTEKISDRFFNEENGVFSKVRNSFNEIIYGNDKKPGLTYYIKGFATDISNGFMNVVSGREYISIITGKRHEARKETMLSIFKNGFNSLMDESKKAFGIIKGTNTGKSVIEIIKDKVSSFTASASHVLFGTMDESLSPKEFFQREISPRMPKTLLGAVSGIGLSLFTPLGLLGGITLGGATGFLSNFDSFKNVLFGEEGSEKRIRIDSAFKKVNEALPRMGVGSLVGGALSLFTPFGLVGGMTLGGLSGFLSKSDKFKEFLFGDEKSDKKGLMNRAYYEKFKSYLPGGTLGAGLGVVGSMFLPGGPVGGALVGLTMGIAGQSNMIKTYLFGDEDPNTGKRDGGLFGKFKLFLTTEIVMPLKTFAKDVGSKGLYFLRKELVNPVLDAVAPIKKEMSIIKDNILRRLGEIKDGIIDRTEKVILKPFADVMHKNILDPIKNTFGKLFSGIVNAFKNIISAPSKMINSFGMNLMQQHLRDGNADYYDEWKRKKTERDYKTSKAFQEQQQKIQFEKDRNKMVNDLMRRGKYDKNDPNTQRAIGWMNVNGYKYTENISNKMNEQTSILDRLAKLFGEFKYRWDTRNNFKTNKKDVTGDTSKVYSPNISNSDDLQSRYENQNDRIKRNKNRNKEKEYSYNIPFYMSGEVNDDILNNPKANNIIYVKGNTANMNNTNKNKNKNTSYSIPNINTSNNKRNDNIPNMNNYNYSENKSTEFGKLIDPDKIMNDLRAVRKYTRITSEATDGQLNGLGYNTELISNIMIETFGLPKNMPKGVKMFTHKVKGMFTKIFEFISKPKELVMTVAEKIMSPFKTAFDTIKKIPEYVINITNNVLKTTMGAIKTMANGVFKIIPELLHGINTIAETVGGVVVNMFKSLPSVIKAVSSSFMDLSKVVANGAVQGIKLLGTGLVKATSAAGDLAIGLAKTTKEVLPMFAKGLMSALGVIGKGAMNALIGGFQLGKKALGGIFGSKKKNRMMNNIIDIDRINTVDTINIVKMVEKIGDVRLYESLGNISTAIYSLKTGTDDMPITIGKKDNTVGENELNNDRRAKKKDDHIKGAVIDITDRINKKKDKEKREKNNSIPSVVGMNTVIDDQLLPSTGNSQMDAFRSKEIGENATKNAKIRNALSIAGDKANVSTGKIISRVFKKGGILSTIGTIAMALLPKLLDLVTNLKSRALSLGKSLIDHFLSKFKLPSLGGLGGSTASNILNNSTPNTGAVVTNPNSIVKGAAESELKHAGLKSAEKGAEKLLLNSAGKGVFESAEKATGKLLLNGAVKNAGKSTSSLLLNGTVENIGKSAGTYAAEDIIHGASYQVMDDAGKVISKSGLKEGAKRVAQKVVGTVAGDSGIISKVLSSSPVKKLAGSKIASALPKLATFLIDRMKNAGKAIFAKIAAKWGVIIGTGAATAGVIPALWYGGNILYGLTETKKIFKLSQADKPTTLMRTIAGFSAFLSDALTYGLIPTATIAQFLGSLLLSDEEAAHIKSSQEQLQNEYNQYVTDTGDTDMTFDKFNKKVNGGVFSKISDFVVDKTKGAVNGVKSFGAWAGDKISNTAQWAGNKLSQGAQWIGDKASQGFNFIKDTTKNTFDWGVNVGKKAKNFALNNTAFAGLNDDKIRQTFGLADDSNIQVKDRVSQALGMGLSNLTGGLIDQEGISKTVRGVMISGEELWKSIGDTVNDYKEKAKDGLSQMNKNIGSSLGFVDDDGNPLTLTEGISHSWDSLVQDGKNAFSWAKETWNNLSSKMGEFVADIGDGISKANTNIGNYLGLKDDDGNSLSLTDGIGYNLSEFGKGLYEGAKGLWEGLKSSISQFVEWSKEGLSKMNEDLGKALNMKDANGNDVSLTEGISQKGSDFKNWLNTKFNNATSYFQNKSDNYRGGSGDEDLDPSLFRGGEGQTNGVYYSQNQGPWANMNYGYNKTLSQSGCGPTAAAMMISSVTGKKVTPDQTAKDALNGGYRLKGNGTRWDYLNSAGNKYGVTTTQTSNFDSVKSALKANHPVILNGRGNGPYTRKGHYVMATGMTQDGKVMINDPLSKSRSGAYDQSVLKNSTAKAWISNKPMNGGSGFDGDESIFGGEGMSKGELVVQSARKLIGKPYRWGGNYPPLGNSDGTDCSGLCQFAYHDALGIDIPRTTYAQLDGLRSIDGSDLRPGDLIYPHNGHVFMYAGNNQVIEAMKTGTNISEHEYTRKGTMFRRVLDDSDTSDTGSSSGTSTGTTSTNESSSSGDKLTDAFSQLGKITSSYVGTIIGGETWDESKMKQPEQETATVTGGTNSSVSGDMSSISGYQTGTSEISSAVLALRPTVEKYANQYGIGDKVDLLLAQIMQEAGGEPHALATDPMQSAEGHGMAAGSLNDPEKSIMWGCEEFSNRLKDANGNIPLALQSYNFGKGFISYANSNGGMSQDVVNQFSNIWAGKMGWSSYGDKQYVQHVLRYYHGSGSGFDESPSPFDISSMRNFDYSNYQGGAGDEEYSEQPQSSIDTNQFIYDSYKKTNENAQNILAANNYSKNHTDELSEKYDEIIALLSSINKNTAETVNAVNRNTNKLENIKSNTVAQTQVIKEMKTNNAKEIGTKKVDAFDKFSSSSSSTKVNNAYLRAKNIARGR